MTSQEQTSTGRQPYKTLQMIDDEDLEDASISLNIRNGIIEDKELISFIEKYTSASEGFHDYYLHSLRDFFGSGNSLSGSSSTLWVENPITGSFVQVNTHKAVTKAIMQTTTKKSAEKTQQLSDEDKHLENSPLIPKLDEEDIGTGNEKTLYVPPSAPKLNINDAYGTDQWTQVTMEYRNFAFVKRCVFLIFQGLLGGFCVVTIFIQRTASSSDDFLLYYQPMAQEVRRYFYILSTISLVGSIDYLITCFDFYSSTNPFSQDIGANMITSLEDYQKVSVIAGLLVLLLHAITFFCVMLMSSFDVQVFLKDAKATLGNQWVITAMENSDFEGKYSNWSGLQNVRAITALIAWIGCCFLLWRDIARFSKLWISLKRVRRHALSWMKRARALEGSEELDKLSHSELRDIIGVMEVALKRARHALSFHDMEEFKKTP